MARIQKKFKKKTQPKPSTQEQSKPKEKVGKDYLLISVITLTTIVTLIGWSTLTNLNRALYLLLILSLSLTYVRRHYNLNKTQETWVDRGSLLSMGIAIILFAIVMYTQVFA